MAPAPQAGVAAAPAARLAASRPCRSSSLGRSRRALLRPCAVAAPGSSQPVPPFNVVITGGSKGVGRALAAQFLRAGDNVVICARDGSAVQAAVEELRPLGRQHDGSARGAAAVHGMGCNVARPAEVAAFADFAKEQLGSVDMWINNAGTNAYRVGPLASQEHDDIISIVESNVIGVMLGCKEAIRVMRDQPTGGHIFNMDGAGADGNPTPRFAAYGATKRGLAQLGKSLRVRIGKSELRSEGLKKIGVHNLSPGMVTTDLLMAGTNTPVAKWFVNCLAEEPETVAEFLVPRIRAVPEASRSLLPWDEGVGRHQYIRFLTNQKAYSQIFARLLTGARKNRFVPEE